MNTEVEAKFLDVDLSEIRRALQTAGATCIAPMRLMRRVIVDYPDRRMQKGEQNSFVRVRDEGDKITLTYKRFEAHSLSGAKEIEVTVSSLEDTVALFEAIGLTAFSVQESKRETWRLGESEIVLDEWPWLNPYIEIEAETEEQVHKTAEALGLDWKHAMFGDIMTAYRHQYPHLSPTDTVGKLPEVRFGAPLPDLLVP